MNATRTPIVLPLALLIILFCSSGCAVVGGIFKAGVWVGIVAVVLVIALLGWVVRVAMR